VRRKQVWQRQYANSVHRQCVMHLVGRQLLVCHICRTLCLRQAVWLDLPLLMAGSLMCSLYFGVTTRTESCLICNSRFELDG
jgi:hypothetical protein